MTKERVIQINLQAANEIIRLLDQYEETFCKGCDGTFHDDDCPAKKAFQLRNYLNQRVNNPTRHYGV